MMSSNNDRSCQPDLTLQVEQILSTLKEKPSAYLVAVTGIPGSGKSTLCEAIVSQVPDSTVLPMDGYHLPRNQLSSQDMKRRGAPHTFDHQSLYQDLKKLCADREGLFPAFDHATKDPEPDAIRVSPATSLVIVEGNYLMLSDWELESIFDFSIFLDCDLQVAMNRVASRLHSCGICATAEEADFQVQNNDLPNAQLILNDGTAGRSDLCVYQS